MRSRLTVVILAALAAGALQASETRILFAPSRVLKAGEVVTVGWEGVPAGVEELEFLLEREDGEVVRLTPQLIPSNGSFRWTVPNLPSRAAVLVLRAGIHDQEVEIASSQPFAIREAARDTRLEFREGEWWAHETRPPVGDVRHLHRVRTAKEKRTFTRPRQSLLSVRMQSGAAQPFEVRDVTAVRVDTRCGAPRIVPQRK
ncbi:MAG: hypothetical protein AABO58_21685 [Acidobacteriota bacterium]